MNDLKTSKLSGHIKSMCEYRYYTQDEPGSSLASGLPSGKLPLGYSDHTLFNRVGNITERTRYNAEKKLVHKNYFTYNENEKLDMHYIHEPGGVSMKHMYRYDNKGVCKEIDFYIYGFIPGHFYYFTDEKEGRYQLEVYDIDGELMDITYYKNDEMGNLVDLKRCLANGRVLEHYISRYDDQNRETERTGLVMDCCSRLVILFDEKENEKELIHYDREDKIEKHFINEYSFDGSGNWIKKTVFMNGALHEMEEREYVYY